MDPVLTATLYIGGIGLISAATYGTWLYWAGDVPLALLQETRSDDTVSS